MKVMVIWLDIDLCCGNVYTGGEEAALTPLGIKEIVREIK